LYIKSRFDLHSHFYKILNMKISIIVPAFNESKTLKTCIDNIYSKNPQMDLEVILINNGSTDNTEEIAKELEHPNLKYIRLDTNKGKGGAIKTGLRFAIGDIIIIQDADLEYDPADYTNLVKPIEESRAKVVYGSRVLKKGNKKAGPMFYLGGRFLSFLTNLLYGSHITDEPVCYKVFASEIIKNIDLKAEGFEFCPEVTAKILKQKIPIYEVPISYYPRSVKEGKKIKFSDGIKAVWTLVKYRFFK
jgi:dolichol-phosphate mannosyltransferase